MNRIFHARVGMYNYLYLLMVTGVVGFSLWHKMPFIAVAAGLLLIVTIERIIHTTYTVTTDNRLIIYYGRFSRKIIIDVRDISFVKKCHSMDFRGCHCSEYLLIGYGEGRHVSLMPVKEEEFIRNITERIKETEKFNTTIE